MFSQVLRTISLFLVIAAIWPASAADSGDGRAEIKQQRKQAAHRMRRIIMNNDGNDVMGADDELRTRENFLSKRTTALAGTQVDAIFYCTGIFNRYSHHGTESEILTAIDGGISNYAYELGCSGMDSLATIVDFGHKNNMEVFWSMRMNDTHDSGDAALFGKWKTEHPELLMGKKGDKFKAGGNRWSAVNYELPEVRDKVFHILQDVAARYDVDGLELDFFRHSIFFKPQMLGEPVTQKQRDLMTELLQRVRKMADETAANRSRPLLIAVRVPDSAGFAAEIGLDLERWMQDDLIDILVTTSYFQLNPWQTSVELGRKYDVPVYACLSEPRFKREESRRVRHSDACYRGRALDAWNAGVDGIYTFNMFNPHSRLWRELGDRETLESLDQLYAAGPLDTATINRWLSGGRKWLNLPTPLPEKPITTKHGEKHSVAIHVYAGMKGEDVAAHGVKLRLLPKIARGVERLSVSCNGIKLGAGKCGDKWIEYPVPAGLVKQGENTLELSMPTQAKPVTICDAVLEIGQRAPGEAK